MNASFNNIKIGRGCPNCAGKAMCGIEECHEFAISKGWECLSDTYITNKTHLKWRCSENHEWNASFNSIKNGTGCPNCSGNAMGSIEECKAFAESKGWTCLSTKYIGSKSHLKWQCSDGHEWNACFNNIKKESGCPECRKLTFGSIEECKAFAISNGWTCLSTKYIGSKSHLKWRCSKNHEWDACFNNIKNGGTGCPECNILSQMCGIEECHEFAISKGWTCLSTKYIGSKSHLKWRCSDGHEWNACFNNVKSSGNGCPYCAGNAKGSIEECKAFAESKGWECLSDVYINCEKHLKWRCSKKHEWDACFHNIKNIGSGCPNCLYKSEAMTRDIIEEEMGYEFPKKYPAFLEGLELDGYCPELNMAFEYNGIQHYEYVPHYHRNGESEFLAQRDRDIKKYKICKDLKINLIIIPHQYTYQKPNELKVFIIDELLKVS